MPHLCHALWYCIKFLLLDFYGAIIEEISRPVIQHCIVFATRHHRKSGQGGDHGSSAVLAIQPQQGARFRKLMRLQVGLDGFDRPAQFLAIASVPFVAKTAEPLMRVGEAQTTVRVRTTSPRLRPV